MYYLQMFEGLQVLFLDVISSYEHYFGINGIDMFNCRWWWVLLGYYHIFHRP